MVRYNMLCKCPGKNGVIQHKPGCKYRESGYIGDGVCLGKGRRNGPARDKGIYNCKGCIIRCSWVNCNAKRICKYTGKLLTPKQRSKCNCDNMLIKYKRVNSDCKRKPLRWFCTTDCPLYQTSKCNVRNCSVSHICGIKGCSVTPIICSKCQSVYRVKYLDPKQSLAQTIFEEI